MIYNKIKEKILLLAVVLPIMMLAQNEVCFEIEPNPNPFDPALHSFSKYVNVLDCVNKQKDVLGTGIGKAIV